MIEVLVTMVILAVGILGLAAVTAKMQQSQTESYQRSQAILLLQDMSSRLRINGGNAASYVTGTGNGTAMGTGDTTTNCSTSPATPATADLCQWSNALQGAAETIGSGSTASNTGAMIGARGCIEQIQAADPTPGLCTPGIYRVSVVWQGLTPIAQSALACGKNLYGSDDTLRRAISERVTIGLPLCN